MVFVQEMCLIPSNLVNEMFNSDINVNANIKKTQSNVLPKDRNNLYSLIKNTFKSKNKLNKANDLYSWILKNYQDFEVSNLGDVIQPIKNIIFLEFMQDIFSTSNKKISKEKLNLYKIFTSIIDIPSMYIDNKLIKNFIHPNLLTFQKPSTIKRKKEEINDDLLNLSDNDNDNDFSNVKLYNDDKYSIATPAAKSQKRHESRENLENFIDQSYTAVTPVRTKSLRIHNKMGTGGKIIRKKNPVSVKNKWLSF